MTSVRLICGGTFNGEKQHQHSWWPFVDIRVMAYTEEANSGRSKSTGKGLISALRFFKYIFGANFGMELISPVTIQKSKGILSERKLPFYLEGAKELLVLCSVELVYTARVVLPRELVICSCSLGALFGALLQHTTSAPECERAFVVLL